MKRFWKKYGTDALGLVVFLALAWVVYKAATSAVTTVEGPPIDNPTDTPITLSGVLRPPRGTVMN